MRYNHLDMLPEKAFQRVGKRMTLEGGGSGGGGSSTTTSTNMPTYAKPYYQELMKQAGKNIFERDEEGYVTGIKGAGELPQQTRVGMQDATAQGIQGISNLQTPGQFGQATQGLAGGQQLGYGTAVEGLNRAFNYNPSSATFGSPEAAQYMSPYQQNVTDIALREAMQRGNLQKQGNAMSSIGRGTFGGARQALLQAEGDRNLMTTLGDIQAQGSQQAFQNAQQQFNADQQRKQQAEQYAATLGSQLGLGGMQAGIDTSAKLGALGTEQQNAELARLQAQIAAGEKQQAQMQGESDTDYQNRMAALNYEKQQLQFYSDILRGNAGALGSTQVNYAAPPSAASQMAGLGIAGLGLTKALS
jgi:hypothetical protein